MPELRIPMLRNFFLDMWFDSTYPFLLSNVLSKPDYETSMRNINAALVMKPNEKVYLNIFRGLSALAVILIIALVITMSSIDFADSGLRIWIILFVLFVIILVPSMLYQFWILPFITSEREMRLRMALQAESNRYATSTIPVNFRLESVITGVVRGNRMRPYLEQILVVEWGLPGMLVPIQIAQVVGQNYQFTEPQMYKKDQEEFTTQDPPPKYERVQTMDECMNKV